MWRIVPVAVLHKVISMFLDDERGSVGSLTNNDSRPKSDGLNIRRFGVEEAPPRA